MNKEVYSPFDREAKATLLNALKRGYFEQSDVYLLGDKGNIPTCRPLFDFDPLENDTDDLESEI